MSVIEQMSELNVRAALLSGGEFLIRPDALQILRALAEKGIWAGIESNGVHFPPGLPELAKEMQSEHLLGISVSLDGGTEETHERLRGPRSFGRTIAGLRLLKERGITFNIQCVLNNSNYTTICNLYELAKELSPECQAVQWAILNPVGRGATLVKDLGLSPADISAVFELIASTESGFSGRTIVKVPPAVIPPKHLAMMLKNKIQSSTTCQFPLLGVLPNGDVTICAVSRDNPDLYFGNVREEGFRLREVWERTRMDMLRSHYVAGENLTGICGDCVWKYDCKGSCRAWAFEEGGSFDSPFPICQALDDAGVFPRVYRLSVQNAAAAEAFRQMSLGCGCSI